MPNDTPAPEPAKKPAYSLPRLVAATLGISVAAAEKRLATNLKLNENELAQLALAQQKLSEGNKEGFGEARIILAAAQQRLAPQEPKPTE